MVLIKNNAKIQQRLLVEKTLTYKTAVELAQSLETAAKNVKELCPRAVNRVVPPTWGRTLNILLVIVSGQDTFEQIAVLRMPLAAVVGEQVIL